MRTRSNAWIMWRLLGLTRPLAGVMALSVICGVAGHCCAILIPVLAVAEALSLAGVTAGAWPALSPGACAAVLAGLGVLRGVLHYLEQTCNHYIAFKLLAQVRSQVFASLRRLSPAKLAGADKGSIISTVTADIELLEVFFAHTVSPVGIATLTCAVMVRLIGGLAWQLGVVAAVGYLLVGVAVPLAVSRACAPAGVASRTQAAALSTYVLDGLRGLAEVLQFGAAATRLDGLDERSEGLAQTQRRLAAGASTGAAVTQALVTVLSLTTLVVGAALWGASSIDAPSAVLATVLQLSSFGPVIALANLGGGLQGTLASARRVIDLLDEEPQVEEVLEGDDIAFEGAAMKNVSFAYDEERVLDNVSLSVPVGGIVGITGASGSGKSTLCRLLMRFWDVTRGQVSISAQRIDTIRTDRLRELESLVEQDTYLFHGSIKDNLLIARPDASQGQLEEACRAASVHDFIMSLPRGYDTPVGELGDTLSGGERQRLGLARAFLHDAPFLILDEPTSNLDALNEGVILRSLDEQRGRRTVLVVSHRASTMAVADASLSMDRGRMS
ncbi:amino acid ABC transporter ATP-binding/permease protein [Olsenella sp. HMSC062G07]|uniref:amino acid ABC transporter ATP-binding/permease protein n=1 Tax=Olsenella sp. HMSC062G07 TaxID=1739330 RepID=UPI000A7683F9|nr:ABC transporter ATP-binding protein [Olsenella sp. HMSC062G07]